MGDGEKDEGKNKPRRKAGPGVPAAPLPSGAGSCRAGAQSPQQLLWQLLSSLLLPQSSPRVPTFPSPGGTQHE